MRKCPQRILIVIQIPEFERPAADGFQRIRRLLKSMIRNYGLRAESIEPIDDTEGSIHEKEQNQ